MSGTDRPPLVLTRPAQESARWLRQLTDLGVPAVELPLIEIQPVDDALLVKALNAARARMNRYAALMFVSANAVQGFFDGGRVPSLLPCWATGPGTASALRRAGVPAELVVSPPAQSGQFDSEALWAIVGHEPWHGRRVLIVRGTDSATADAAAEGQGRDWLSRQLHAKGAKVDFVVAYQRVAPRWDEALLARAHELIARRAVWLFSSSQAVRNIAESLLVQGAPALATHERVAQAARERGFDVRVCGPRIDDVVRSIESIHD